MLTWDLTIFGNTIGNKDRGEIIPRTWFHSFFSRKKSEIQIAFPFFEKWKVKNKIPSLFFEKWKWNWNGSRSRTRSENEKKFSRILKNENLAGLCYRCYRVFKKGSIECSKETDTNYSLLTNSKMSIIINNAITQWSLGSLHIRIYISDKHRRFEWRSIILELRVSALQTSDPKPIIDLKSQNYFLKSTLLNSNICPLETGTSLKHDMPPI